MEIDGFEHRVPVKDSREDRAPLDHLPTERVERTDENLAQYLPRLIEQKGRGEIDIYAEPIGYERDYPKDVPSPDETLGG